MIYSYADLKGIIKVGDKVRAVPGKRNGCDELNSDGSNEQTITHVSEYNFHINRCVHWYGDDDIFLDLNPEPTEITWDTLKVGDWISNGKTKREVMAVVGELVAYYSFEITRLIDWASKLQLSQSEFFIIQPTPAPKQKTTLSMDDIATKFGIDVKDLEIVKE